MSSRRSRRSSSTSRKTWLSSTSRTRIGPATRRKLLRGEEERIVGLAPVLHIELEVRMPLLKPLHEARDVRFVVAGKQRQHVARLGQQALGDGGRDLAEVGAARNGLAAG